MQLRAKVAQAKTVPIGATLRLGGFLWYLGGTGGDARSTSPGSSMFSEFSRFKASKKLIQDGADLFYVFPDHKTKDLPSSLDDALDQGFLVITCTDKPGQYYLNIANEQYTGDFNGLALILFDWAHSEGYQWPEARRVTLPGEPEPIRYRQTASGYRVAWDEPGENF